MIEPPAPSLVCVCCNDCITLHDTCQIIRKAIETHGVQEVVLSEHSYSQPVVLDQEAVLKRLLQCEKGLVRLMAHVLRCTAQAFEVRKLEAEVARNPTHKHIVVDFKVIH